ncbi:unnamed protein product [Prunus brigantina]
MPFGLKNAGATYQRLVNRMFAQLLGQSIEVYVDDMLVKSRTTDQHVDRLTEVFAFLRQYRMRLNPAKCVFGVESGKFLGFMSTDRCLPFFKAIRGAHRHIDWTEECDEAFRKLKAHMGTAPVLSKPEVGETLGLYLSVSECAVSSILTREVEGSQRAVHGGGAGIVLSAPDGTAVEYALRFQFKTTNNEAEYEALLAGLRLAHDLGAQGLRAHSDSLLIVNQINDTYQARGRRMA